MFSMNLPIRESEYEFFTLFKTVEKAARNVDRFFLANIAAGGRTVCSADYDLFACGSKSVGNTSTSVVTAFPGNGRFRNGYFFQNYIRDAN